MASPLPVTSKFRTIVEMSSMSNNEEVIIYMDCPFDPEKHQLKTRSEWCDPALVISRPVYEIEVKEGLVIREKPISQWDEEVPKVTSLIDAIYKFKAEKGRWQQLDTLREEAGEKVKITLSSHLSEYVARSFYDCMSGGMPIFEISIVKFLLENVGDVNWDEAVYPKTSREGDPWYTLRDFYEESAKRAPDLKSEMTELTGIASSLLLGPVGDEVDVLCERTNEMLVNDVKKG